MPFIDCLAPSSRRMSARNFKGRPRLGKKRPELGVEQFSDTPAWWEGRRVACARCNRSLIANRENCMRIDAGIYAWCHDCRDLTLAVNLGAGIP
jgi:hypothetical protein